MDGVNVINSGTHDEGERDVHIPILTPNTKVMYLTEAECKDAETLSQWGFFVNDPDSVLP